MAEVLSQSQIDALLAAAMSGDQNLSQKKEEKKYQKYDFRSPRKYTKERLKMLTGVFETYSKVLNTRINGLMHSTCEVEVDTVDEQRYYEFSNALVDGEVVTLAYMELNGVEEEAPIIILISPTIMVSMMDRMMGGNGDVEDDLPTDYAYTDLDLVIYQDLMEEFISILPGSWETYISVNFGFRRVEPNPTLVQLIGVEESVVLVSLNIKFPNCSGRIDFCLPDSVLAKIFTQISKGNNMRRRDMEDHTEDIRAHLQESHLEIIAELGHTSVQLRDIYELNVGDVIDMNMRKDAPLVLRVGGKKWFTGLIGVHEKHMAVKIQETFNLSDGGMAASELELEAEEEKGEQQDEQ